MDLSQNGNYNSLMEWGNMLMASSFVSLIGNGRYSSNVNNSMTKGKKEMMMKKALCAENAVTEWSPSRFRNALTALISGRARTIFRFVFMLGRNLFKCNAPSWIGILWKYYIIIILYFIQDFVFFPECGKIIRAVCGDLHNQGGASE